MLLNQRHSSLAKNKDCDKHEFISKEFNPNEEPTNNDSQRKERINRNWKIHKNRSA